MSFFCSAILCAGHFSRWDFMCSSLLWHFSFCSYLSRLVSTQNISCLLLSIYLRTIFTFSPKPREVVPKVKGNVSWNPLFWTWLSTPLCSASQPLYARMTSSLVKLHIISKCCLDLENFIIVYDFSCCNFAMTLSGFKLPFYIFLLLHTFLSLVR